ncbi:MAG: Pyruvate phosphate dikinase [Cenarchaeum symbiont of Oopsacas minuta]|nr:Pyruvate phosphate dikinase [Cenarchaeum symbiont of Oopsacas minuta]
MKAVYDFTEGDGTNKKLLGGKGAGLVEMTRLKLPVPPGFVITTEVCKAYYADKKRLGRDVLLQISRGITRLEKKTGKGWNDSKNPLLVSVRSGAAISMPGMMDTILNLGLNDSTVKGLASASGNPRFAWDSYRRFIQLFGKVVFGIDDKLFEVILSKAKQTQGVKTDGELTEESLRSVVSDYKNVCKEQAREFPSNPQEQLELAVKAVFSSWMGQRAIVYREKNHISRDIADGTAVNVVTMAFGNMGKDSATGVVFTRNPGDGQRRIFGEYLINAQGEDVVAGTRTPKPVDMMKTEMPASYKTLVKTCSKLERHYREPQDIEFTIERGKFYLLQTRNAKMNATAMIKTSVDMVNEHLIPTSRAITRLNAEQLEQMLHKMIDSKAVSLHTKVTVGIPASPGAATGVAVFDVKRATAMGDDGENVILVREETKPEDVPAFFSSVGILTSRGGKTSHAAVVARGMGKPCIVGSNELHIDAASSKCTCKNVTISEGDTITIDGSTGSVYLGAVPTLDPKMTKDFSRVLGWSARAKKIGVRANADTPEGAKLAAQYGAEGIGLCRTERMFNGADRIQLFVDMIMAKSRSERAISLEKLGTLQKNDFVKILTAMKGKPVTIRLLDPPLHEFLPNPEELAEKIRTMGESDAVESRVILERARELAEINPMMGHRGVRVAVTYPEIYEMQIKAVFEAAAEMLRRKVKGVAQIMVPQVGSLAELDYIKGIYDHIKVQMQKKYKTKFNIHFGTMIEVVRAALTAGELARTAEFFSFGTNDLTQATFSFSREDAEGKFLPEYIEKEILDTSPFQSIDEAGVGGLMEIALDRGRKERPKMEAGICGEHGGDPRSIVFCHGAGLNYVSASPHRIPIAIVAAAQAAITNTKRMVTKSRRKKHSIQRRR